MMDIFWFLLGAHVAITAYAAWVMYEYSKATSHINIILFILLVATPLANIYVTAVNIEALNRFKKEDSE